MLRFLLFLFLSIEVIYGSDYYELLGVSRSATTQEIRKSFKKLALVLHPDKNPDDVDAQEKFLKINRAYEILKDESKRKNYDIHGDDKPSTQAKYQSYYYYENQFGLYDDDPHVVTLSGTSDFDRIIENSETFGQWFIKFYSPLCSSCHHAAPAWSKLASELNGAVSFGAVNCEDDNAICRHSVNINAYPTYMLFPSGAILVGGKNKEELKNFLMSRLKYNMLQISDINQWDEVKNMNNRWILILQKLDYDDTDHNILAAMMKGLTGVALIKCYKMDCSEFQTDENNEYIYMEKHHESWNIKPLQNGEPQEISSQILSLLPPITKLDYNSFEEYFKKLENGLSTPMLVYFHLGPPTTLDMEVKKLTALLPNFIIGSIHCGRYNNLCSGLSVSHYPVFAIFKTGGGKEFYHGSHTVQGVASFAVESSQAVNFWECDPDELSLKIKQGPTLVDFYAPWCPPCIKLIPELRKASLNFVPSVITFASIDCTVHSDACRQHSVTSYPTTIIFNITKQPIKMTDRTATSIKEFIDDTISPKVIELDENLFHLKIGRKKKNELFIVDFYAPWCGPCQQLEPHFRKLAKALSDVPKVYVAKVNCEDESMLCRDQAVRSYPHIRLYPMKSEGLNTFMIYSGYQRDARSLRKWVNDFLPSSVVNLDPDKFNDAINSGEAWLVDFYAPWCGHCVAFEPDFTLVSQKLDGRVKTGKLDCARYPEFCQSLGINSYPTIKLFFTNYNKGLQIESQNPSVIIETVDMYLASNIHDEL